MLRLVQGDVGSGKTVVAALAMLQAIANGYQAAFMAPTELLAEQHYKNICTWFEQLGLSVAWLSGSTKGKKRAAMLEIIADGRAKIAVGTHALFQEGVEFNKLGLVVIDEQHRFGVHQRLALREKGAKEQVYPHQLIMTATPIPRTLAMTAYADLDHSIIDELPPGRTPVKTAVIPNSRRNEMIEHIRTACRDKRQAYWVCSLIEESEVLECQAAEATAALLQDTLAELKIGLVHGRMKAAAKEQVMADFKAGHYDLLVATTVFPRFAGWGRRAGDCIGMKFSVPRARWYRLAATADRVPSGPDGVRGLRPLQSSGVDLVGEWVRKRPSRVTSLQRANRSGKTHSYPRTREGSRTRRETRPGESEEAAQPEQKEPPSRSPRTRGHRASFPRRSLITGGGACPGV